MKKKNEKRVRERGRTNNSFFLCTFILETLTSLFSTEHRTIFVQKDIQYINIFVYIHIIIILFIFTLRKYCLCHCL